MKWFVCLVSAFFSSVSLAADPSSLSLDFPFHGVQLKGEIPLQTPEEGPWRSLAERNDIQIQVLAQWVTYVADKLDLDDYGRFRLSQQTLEGLSDLIVEVDKRPATRSLQEALQNDSWTPTERLHALSSLLQAQGYASAMVELTSGPTLAIELDPSSLTLPLTLSLHGGKDEMLKRFALFQKDRINVHEGELIDEHIPTLMALEGTPFAITSRELPEFVLRRADEGVMVPQNSESRVRFNDFPNAASYLSAFPTLNFRENAEFTLKELERTGLADALRSFVEGSPSEVAAVNSVLRLFQANLQYEEGPLESLTETLHQMRGDCDQQSALMHAALQAIGYPADHILAISDDHHLALALRPRTAGPDRAAQLKYEGQDWWILDPVHYRRDSEGNFRSKWGDPARGFGEEVDVQPLLATTH